MIQSSVGFGRTTRWKLAELLERTKPWIENMPLSEREDGSRLRFILWFDHALRRTRQTVGRYRLSLFSGRMQRPGRTAPSKTGQAETPKLERGNA